VPGRTKYPRRPPLESTNILLLLLTEGTMNGAKYTELSTHHTHGGGIARVREGASRVHDPSHDTWYAFSIWS